jgi:hypothetical protein
MAPKQFIHANALLMQFTGWFELNDLSHGFNAVALCAQVGDSAG